MSVSGSENLYGGDPTCSPSTSSTTFKQSNAVKKNPIHSNKMHPQQATVDFPTGAMAAMSFQVLQHLKTTFTETTKHKLSIIFRGKQRTGKGEGEINSFEP